MNRAFIVTGLLHGDEGKGGVVAALTAHAGADLVIRHNGGGNAAHNVVTDTGIHHTFSQFGSGTFAGAKTLLSRYMLVNPLGMEIEEEHLRKKGVIGSFNNVYIDERALITTPFHRSLNRLRELSRGVSRHGSCGAGIGETMRHTIERPNESLCLKDIQSPKLITKLDAVRRYCLEQASQLTLLPSDTAATELAVLFAAVEPLATAYVQFSKRAQVCNPEQVNDLLRSSRVAIFEGAQGVLLDETYGYHPYTTWSTTTSLNAQRILREMDYHGALTQIGVMRTFATRHGAGPFPTESEAVYADPYNPDNDWQKSMRYGWLDLTALKYALQVNPVDYLAVTHVDVLDRREQWPVCHSYRWPLEKPENPTLAGQEVLGMMVEEVDPIYVHIAGKYILRLIRHKLDIPIGIVSRGPKSSDKEFLL